MCLVARSFERGVVAKMGQKPIYDKPFSPHLGTWTVHNRLRIGPQRAGLVGGTHWWGGMLYIACSQPENRVTRIAHVPSNPGPQFIKKQGKLDYAFLLSNSLFSLTKN